jgi:hypothetical protein
MLDLVSRGAKPVGGDGRRRWETTAVWGRRKG